VTGATQGGPTGPGSGFGGVLQHLSEALEQCEQRGISSVEAADELRALRELTRSQPLDDPSTLPEIDAVTHRLGRLARKDPLDEWQLRETVEQAAEVLRVMRTDIFRLRLDTQPQEALELVHATLRDVPEEEVERLLGAGRGELGVWHTQGVPAASAARVQIASQVLLDLRRSMSPEGMIRWLSAERAQLEGLSPLQVLDRADAGDDERLRRLAQAPHSVLAV